jgi:hypothetical protein
LPANYVLDKLKMFQIRITHFYLQIYFLPGGAGGFGVWGACGSFGTFGIYGNRGILGGLGG